MKKITLIIVLITLFFGVQNVQSQTINIDANWPNTEWVVTGTYTGTALLNSPIEDAHFTFDDDAAGSGSLLDNVSAESPVIDLTSATVIVPHEEQLVVTVDYVFPKSGSEILQIQWYDAEAHLWILWDDLPGNSTSYDYQNCSNMETYVSSPLLIANFTPVQLQNFQYRLAFDDDGWNYGFCFGSPTLTSEETPDCFQVSDLDASNILDDRATISWDDNNPATPQDGWEIEYGVAGYSFGTGTTFTSPVNPFLLTGLEPSTCYDVYVRALCDDTNDINSEWTGPINFCTPIHVAGCGDMFYDIGGPDADYDSGLNETTTICPDNVGTDVVTIIFDAFFTEYNWDFFKIYDGPSALADDSNLLGTYDGDLGDTTAPGVDGSLPPMTSATLANGGCLTFVFTSDSSVTKSGWEAEILCSPPITCFKAEGLGVNESSITLDTAEIFWTDTNTDAGEPANGWIVEYGLEGFTPGVGEEEGVVNAPTNPFTLTGLDSSTDYCYYMRASCSDQDSFWEGPVCFTTDCEVKMTPYSETFDNGGEIPMCWEQGDANAENWQFSNDVTEPGHIGISGNVNGTTTLSGGYFAWVDDDSPHSTNTVLLSPFVDLTGVAQPTVGFYYITNHEFIGSNASFSVDIWDGTTWNNDVFTHSGDTNGWVQEFVDLSAFIDDIIQVRFVVDEVGTGTFDDFAIDDVFIGELPGCVNVNAITLDNISSNDVTLTWTDGNIPAETTWQIVHGTPGFDPDTGTPVDITPSSTGVLYGGLTESTSYDLYIRSDCGADGYSLWAGPISFTTLCLTEIAPYTEDFEHNGNLDACWTQNDGLDAWQFATAASAPDHFGTFGSASSGITESRGYFAYVDDSEVHALNNSITTPLIDVSGLAEATLYFYYISDNEGSSNVQFSVDVWDGATWQEDFFTSNSNTDGWQEKILDLTGLTITGDIQVRFTVDENNGTDFRDDFAIDDVRIDEAPLCWPIFDPVISNETATTLDITWLDNDNDVPPDTTYYIEYGPVGFTRGTGTTQDVSPFANPYTITGLDVDTDFDLYVYAICDPANPDAYSWVGPVQGTTLPTCLKVTDITYSNSTSTSVDITWADNNPITPPVGGWDIKITYPTENFEMVAGVLTMIPGVIDVINVPQNATFPFTIDGMIGDSQSIIDPVIPETTYSRLIPSSFYNIYVRANCEVGDTDSSRWAGPYEIKTANADPFNDSKATAIEINEDFIRNARPNFGNNIQADDASNIATTCTDPMNDGVDSNFDRFDVWYKFTMPSGVTTVLINAAFAGTMEDSVIAVYKGPEDNLTPAESYYPDGSVNIAYRSCVDDSDLDLGSAFDNNNFSVIQLQNVSPGDEYYVRIWSADRTNIDVPGADGNIQGQFTLTVRGGGSRFGGILDTEEETIEHSVNLNYYPNPVENTLNLVANTKIKEVRVYSILGQEVDTYALDVTKKEVLYSMEHLKMGTYFVKVLLDNNTTKTIKIIKN